MSVIFIDIDGTVAEQLPYGRRHMAAPLPGAQESVNKIKKMGHTVVFFSARFWDELEMTKSWLDRHGFQYDGIILGKPIFDRLIDDRAGFDGDWHRVLDEFAYENIR